MPTKKGVVLNPTGPLPISDAMKMARKLTRQVFEEIAHKYMFMTYEQITKHMENNKQIPMIDLAVMSILITSVNEGDQKRIDWILDRTIGMSVKRHSVIIEDERPPQTIPVKMEPEERLSMLEQYKKRIEDEIRKQETAVEIIDVKPKS